MPKQNPKFSDVSLLFILYWFVTEGTPIENVVITLTDSHGTCCPPRFEALPSMLISVTSDCTGKLV